MLVRTPISDISTMGRNTQGVKLVNLKDDDRLVGVEVVSETDLEQYAARSGGEALESSEAEPEAGITEEEAPAEEAPVDEAPEGDQD